MAEVGVSFLLENLKLLALHRYDLYKNAENEFQQLENELNVMRGVLEDASRNPRKEESFKAWEKELRDVVYDAEDTVDSWIAEGNDILTGIRTFLSTSMAQKVRDLRENKVEPAFNSARAKLANMTFSETGGRDTYAVRDRENKAPSDNVVGFKDEIATLVKYIYQDAEELDVISIIGMPGLGKTTVAWQIYKHPKIQHDFPILIWIYVSQDFNKKDILLTIMRRFSDENFSTKNEDELSIMVKQKLAQCKFILFMDDVWTPAVWKEIKSFLPMDGKVVVTSRDIKVGRISNSKREPHLLRSLDSEESLELLQIEAFGRSSGFPAILKSICTLIVKPCDGLPLAIIVIGGILSDKRPPGQSDDKTLSEWKIVSENVGIQIIHADAEKRMEKFITLSYATLPYHLKNCFLYMGMFPEDAEISAWKLKQMWIAEGFIVPKPRKMLEEVAHENLKELIGRNLVQVDTIKPNGEVKTCRLHDTIREFCNKEAEQLNLYQEISQSKEGPLHPSIDIVRKCHRLCIRSNVQNILSVYFTQNDKSKARSILCFSKRLITLEKKFGLAISNASKVLRVLEMSSTINFAVFPTKVSKLIHLRYISLSGDEFKALPSDLSSLWNLQTIIVATTHRTLKINADLWKMVHLRHFKTKASVTLDNTGKGSGVDALQTLGRLAPESCTDDVFAKAKNLITLGIRGDLNKVDFKTKGFISLQKLINLKLYHEAYPKSAQEYAWVPSENSFPAHLKSLTLKDTYLKWTDMHFMGKLHTLEVLKLKENSFQGAHWEQADSGGFARLGFLHIEHCEEFVVWEAPSGSFPELRNLVIKNCEGLEAVPFHVSDNLSMMYLERVKKSIANSAEEIAARKNAGLKIPVFKLVVKFLS